MKNDYKAFDKFLVRTPSLPFDHTDLLQPDYFNHPFFQEAIYIASSDLFSEMQKYVNGAMTQERDKEKLNNSLYKYWRRIRTRTTPYGLFSGVNEGIIANGNTQVIFNKDLSKNVRLDMEVLCCIIDDLESDDTIKHEILYFPNDTLYKVQDEVRYFERSFEEQHFFKYSVASATYSPYLKKILAYARKGCTLTEIISYTQSIEKDVDYENLKEFILELIDAKLLISELAPCLTGTDVLKKTIETLHKRNTTSLKLGKLEAVQEKLDELNNSNKSLEHYTGITTILDSLNIKYNRKNAFQLDLYRHTTTSVLSENIVQEILTAIQFLTRLAPLKRPNDRLETFKKVFTEKYEDRELDLLFATDADVGIGYPVSYSGDVYINDLIKDLKIPGNQINEGTLNWNPMQDLLLKKIMEAAGKNTNEIVLDDHDISSEHAAALYPTFYCNFEILNQADGRHLLKLNTFGDSSGANLMARFSHTHPNIETLVKSITKKEEELAQVPILEIVHLTNPRIGNVVIRPQLRTYELTILSNSGLPEDRQIPVSDLTIAIRNGQVVLKSKKLNTTIQAAHTNAFNHSLSTIPVFNLLCDLQYEQEYLNSIAIQPQLNLSCLPRIRYKNVILFPATWHFSWKEMEGYFNAGDKDLLLAANAWQTKYNIPKYILFSEGDNELFINLEDEKNIKSLLELGRKKQRISLKEFLFDAQCDVVKDTDGKIYRNEFSIAYYKTS